MEGEKQSRTAQVFLLMYYANDTKAFLTLRGGNKLARESASFLPPPHGTRLPQVTQTLSPTVTGDVSLAPGLLFWPAVTAQFSERGKSTDDLKAFSFLAGKQALRQQHRREFSFGVSGIFQRKRTRGTAGAMCQGSCEGTCNCCKINSSSVHAHRKIFSRLSRVKSLAWLGRDNSSRKPPTCSYDGKC